jgi:hypothetical protein
MKLKMQENRIKLPDFGLNQIDLSTAIKKAEVNFEDNINEAPICVAIREGQNVIPIGTYGNFSAWVGPQKSRKTYALSMPIASAIACGNYENFVAYTHGKTNILIDTEQATFHVQKVNKRVLFMAKKYGSQPLNFKVYSLRSYNYIERLSIIDHIIKTTPKLGFIVIDGIRDLVRSINDEGEANDVVTNLLQWTHDFDCHIAVVLHLNKGESPSPRGFIGTEIQNKAEAVIEIKKSSTIKGCSEIIARDFRGIEFNTFLFEIIDGIPIKYKGELSSNEEEDVPY